MGEKDFDWEIVFTKAQFRQKFKEVYEETKTLREKGEIFKKKNIALKRKEYEWFQQKVKLELPPIFDGNKDQF